jgi:hypothetical protein
VFYDGEPKFYAQDTIGTGPDHNTAELLILFFLRGLKCKFWSSNTLYISMIESQQSQSNIPGKCITK